jgi:serine/threonine-protein kinase ATR
MHILVSGPFTHLILTDLLFALEDLPAPNATLSSNVPPARSVGKLWPQSENSITLPQGHTITVNKTSHAFVITLSLSQVAGLDEVWQQEIFLRMQRQAVIFKPQLEGAELWESSIEQLLRLPRSWPLLASLLHDAAVIKPSNTPKMSTKSLQQLLARALLESLRCDGEKSRDVLVPALRPFSTVEVWSNLDEDLKIAITTWFTRFGSQEQPPEHVVAMRNGLEQDSAMTDSDFSTAFQELSVCPAHPARTQRRKRRKVLMEDPESRRLALLRRTTSLFTGVESVDISLIPEVAPSIYAKLSEEDRCAVWRCLIELAAHDFETTQATVSRLLETPDLRNDQRPRVLSAIAVKALVQRTEDAAYTALETSQFGKYCLAGINSSLRELRIAAGYLLPCFLRDDLPEDTKEQNRKYALQSLRVLSDRDVASEQETLILAWGQIAISCSDEELQLTLLRLVDYLGHPNPLVVGYAFSEIESISTAKGKRPPDLFQPFWRSVAVEVVKDLGSKPQKTQQLCDLLGMEVNAFLGHTERATLPTLVLTKKKHIIERIALARSNGSTATDVCMQPRSNLASILTKLLSQPRADAEDAALACLAEVAPEFRNTQIVDLVKLDPVLIACEMLKHCGEEQANEKQANEKQANENEDEDEDKKLVAYQAFQLVASIADRNPGQRKKGTRKDLEAFLENHLLGILTHFSTMLEIGPTPQPASERIRCLNGMIEMFVLTQGRVSVALPQIRACLQSALEQEDTREIAFDAWLSLIPVLDEEDVKTILDETLVIIIRHWSAISPTLHQKTHQMLGKLVKVHQMIFQDNIMTLPSLHGVPLLSKFAAEFDRLRNSESVESQARAFARRLRVDGDTLVFQTLTELVIFLDTNQEFIHDTAASEHPSVVLSDLVCALLDVTVRNTAPEAAELCGRALGIIGCLDPNRVEAVRKKRQLLILSNFETADECVDWIVFFFEDVLVKAFKSVTNARQQGFLAYTMQELLNFCGFREAEISRLRSTQPPDTLKRWDSLPAHVRVTLTPLLTSRYLVTSNSEVTVPKRKYPSFNPEYSHSHWLRSMTTDLLFKAKGDNAKAFFPLLARILSGQYLAIPRFIFPYAVLNVVLGGTVAEIKGITDEFLEILQAEPQSQSLSQQETVRLCSENVFAVLDYTSTWLREKRKNLSETRTAAYKTGQSPNEFDEDKAMGQIETIENFLASIPAQIVAHQAMACRSYSRALFYWDQHIRQKRSIIPTKSYVGDDEELFTTLQDIYSQIDEPDGLEGIAAHLPSVRELQTAINHKKAGRWTAAQAWFELQLAEEPDNPELQYDVLECLRETGQYAPLLRYTDSFFELEYFDIEKASRVGQMHLPLAAEASWMTGTLRSLEHRFDLARKVTNPDFNIGIGRLLLHASNRQESSFEQELHALRKSITDGLSVAGTDSLQACHNEVFKLHVLYELEALMRVSPENVPQLMKALDKRLHVIGSYVQDKQYLLGVRRSVMALRGDEVFSRQRCAGLWLTTARLARQSKNTSFAHHAVLNASAFGDHGARLEEARLLWHEGHQRQAILSLEAALKSNIFDAADSDPEYSLSNHFTTSLTASEPINGHPQNALTGKALLLLAKWLDASGQSQTKDMTDRYQLAARRHQRWEKGHYYLGKHYSKLLDAQKALPKDKRTQSFMTGELSKLVIDNSLRSIPFGNKYWHETLPRVLTLWMELGTDALVKAPREDQAITNKRIKSLEACNKQLQKYFERVPPYVFYHALPQLISRITHPHPDVWLQLRNIPLRT